MPALDPETALKRYSEGDRSPEVMEALNQAADQAFDFPPLEDPEPSPLEPWKLDLGLVLPLTFERLLPWVKETKGYQPYLQPDRNRLQIRFNYGSKNDRELFVTISLHGQESTILSFVQESSKRVPPADLSKALRCVNAWNRRMRWPKALVTQEYLEGDDELSQEDRELRERTHSAALRLEAEAPFSQGLHQAGLEALLTAWLSASWEFWENAFQEWEL